MWGVRCLSLRGRGRPRMGFLAWPAGKLGWALWDIDVRKQMPRFPCVKIPTAVPAGHAPNVTLGEPLE